MSDRYSVTTPRTGLTQFTFSNGCVLSVGYSRLHYASWMVGDRSGPEGSQHIPTSFEVEVRNGNGSCIWLTHFDSVAGWQSPSVVATLIQKMSREDFNPVDLIYFCEKEPRK
jgi:hypothetical protein